MLSRSNYEIYFLDYHEGNLTEGQRRELMSFLEQNPDLKEEFDSFVNVSVEPDQTTVFYNKDSLKKKEGVNLSNYKTWLVAYTEGDLNDNQKKEVDLFLSEHPDLKSELDLFRRTRTVPDYTIVFKDKNSLKRGGRVIAFSRVNYRVMAIAASLVLLLISIYVFRQQKDNTPQTAEKTITLPVNSAEGVNQTDSANLKNEKIERNIPAPEKVDRSMVADHRRKKDAAPSNQHQPSHEIQEPAAQVVQNKPAPVDSLIKVNSPLQEPVFANNSAPVSKPQKEQDLREIFNEQDMKDLGLASNAPATTEKDNLWLLASKGASRLSKKTGQPISIGKTNNVVDDATTYALEIGKFSISHTEMK